MATTFTAPPARSDDHAASQPPAPTYRNSRWAGSEVSWGPTGRVVATLLLLGVGPLIIWWSPVGGIVLCAMYAVMGLPWALRDVWRKVRVRQEE